MNKDLFVYFLFLLVPLCVLPFAVHSFMAAEIRHGRDTGRAYLAAEAQNLATDMVTSRSARPRAENARRPILAEIVDDNGRTEAGHPFPSDGRCFGEASLAPGFPGKSVRVTWPGDRGPGFVRRQKMFLVEMTVFGVCGFFILLGSGLLARAILRSRRDSQQQLEYVADFTHRLKTPLTSISLCAELAREGRLDDVRKHEAVETVIAEAAKLDVLVDEVLAYVKRCRRV
ncbi:MAG: histidine kinase dimerization/phospho-acceptor domain-containing protein [Kiritimatiellia bacterium]